MYERTYEVIDETGNLTSHFLDTVAFSSQKTIASIVLLLSTIPEFYGMYWATGNVPISVTASCVSLVVVTLALREKPVKWRTPRFDAIVPIRWFALLYVVQICAGIAFILSAGNIVDIALIAISAVGAVCSERIAVVMIAEAKERNRNRLQLARDKIRIKELTQNAELRIADKKEAFNAKWQIAQDEPSTEVDSAKSMETAHEKPAVTLDTLAENRTKAQQTKAAKVQKRRAELAKLLADNPKMTNAELAQQLGVSVGTIRTDRKAVK